MVLFESEVTWVDVRDELIVVYPWGWWKMAAQISRHPGLDLSTLWARALHVCRTDLCTGSTIVIRGWTVPIYHTFRTYLPGSSRLPRKPQHVRLKQFRKQRRNFPFRQHEGKQTLSLATFRLPTVPYFITQQYRSKASRRLCIRYAWHCLP